MGKNSGLTEEEELLKGLEESADCCTAEEFYEHNADFCKKLLADTEWQNKLKAEARTNGELSLDYKAEDNEKIFALSQTLEGIVIGEDSKKGGAYNRYFEFVLGVCLRIFKDTKELEG